MGPQQGGTGPVDPSAPNPQVSISVNIVGGAPPADLAEHAPNVPRAELAKLERTLMAHLKANPQDAARFLTDPGAILRKVSPKSTGLIASLAATRAASAKTVPGAPPGDLHSVKVTVGQRRRAPTVPKSARPSNPT